MRVKEYLYGGYHLQVVAMGTGYRLVFNNRIYHYSKSFDAVNELFYLYVDKIESERESQ